MNWKDMYKIKLLLIFIFATLCAIGAYVLYFIEIDSKEYIIGGLGVGIFIFPLVSIARYGKRIPQRLCTRFYISLIAYSIAFLIVILIIGDSLLTAIVLLIAITFWTVNIALFKDYLSKIKLLVENMTKISSIFMAIMAILYYINTLLISLDKDIIPAPEGILKIIVGLAIVIMCIFAFKVAPYRVSSIFNFLLFVIWYFEFDTSWMFRNIERVVDMYLGSYIFALVVYLILIFTAGLSFGRFLYESAVLKIANQSILLGPWFKNLFAIKNFKRLDTDQKTKIKSSLIVLCVFSAISVPGILASMNVYVIPITITPKDQQVTFNFWASPDINDSYTTIEKAELNEHRVNLDIMMSMNAQKVYLLKDFEYQMPDITYRITIQPRNISDLLNEVKEVTELMMKCEDNGTLDQWKGFSFDIEGNAYAWYRGFDSIDSSIAIWNEVFDYLELKSLEREKIIETECVNGYEFAVDGIFDGDYDQQFMEGFNSYIPERFSLYAPMVYRCWPNSDEILGIPQGPFDYWMTSYYVYTALYTLQAGVPQQKMGVYLGITNTTCYSADVIQTDPSSWGDHTGFGNLKRDVLIAKHFGIKEVTFFLQFDAYDGDWFGGAFNSYGNGFLDDLNESVNTNPPEEFTIYLSNLDGTLQDKLGRDLFCDFSGMGGLFQIMEICAVTSLIFFMKKGNKQNARNLTN
jgi:hypothetical protein